MKKIFFLITLVLITAYGCSSGISETGFTFGKGKYKFVMKDSSGVKIASGILNVTAYENDKISGTYEFTDITKKDFEGYSSMNGEFSGDVNKSEKTVFINTNPRIADSNVFWRLKINRNSLSGDWTFSVFRGQMTGGFIKITKKN